MAAYPGNASFTPLAIPGSFAHAWPITPSDTVDIGTPCVAINVGTGGTIAVQLAGVKAANPVTLTVATGETVYLQATRVLSTDTTASDLVALW